MFGSQNIAISASPIFRGNLSPPESGGTRIVCKFHVGHPSGEIHKSLSSSPLRSGPRSFGLGTGMKDVAHPCLQAGPDYNIKRLSKRTIEVAVEVPAEVAF